jgi:hypothetical protein
VGFQVFRVRGGGFAGFISKETGCAGLVSKVHLGVSAKRVEVMRLSREVWREVARLSSEVRAVAHLGVSAKRRLRRAPRPRLPSGFRVWGSGFRVQGSGFRIQGSGFRVQGV